MVYPFRRPLLGRCMVLFALCHSGIQCQRHRHDKRRQERQSCQWDARPWGHGLPFFKRKYWKRDGDPPLKISHQTGGDRFEDICHLYHQRTYRITGSLYGQPHSRWNVRYRSQQTKNRIQLWSRPATGQHTGHQWEHRRRRDRSPRPTTTDPAGYPGRQTDTVVTSQYQTDIRRNHLYHNHPSASNGKSLFGGTEHCRHF